MSTIKVKRSAVQGKVPLDADLELGELAINTYDGKLFLKKSVAGANTIVDVIAAAGGTNITTSANGSTVTVISNSGDDGIILAANSTTAGVLTAEAQTIGGIKTFSANVQLATVTAGTWNGSVISGTYGGTGVNNSGKTITLGGNLTTSGSFNITLTALGTTSVTLPSSGTIATVSGVETLENKTLTAPKIANGGFIADANGNEQITFTTAASAVNHLRVINAATGNMPAIISDGADTNIGLVINTKGTGTLMLDTGTGAGDVHIKSGTGSFAIFDTNSSHAVRFVLGNKTANTNLTIPTAGDVTLVAGTMVPTTGTGATGNWSISAASVQNSVTFNNAGTGDNSGTTFNGSVARTISYNTIGSPSTTGTNATGTWNISILGNAATATSATSASTATTLTGLTTTIAKLNFTNTVTSNIQNQLNSKAPTSNPTVTGTLTTDRIRINSVDAANNTSTTHGFQIGPTNGVNLILDRNSIEVRNNGVGGLLALNSEGGGSVNIGGATTVSPYINLRATVVNASGDIVASGNVTAHSDERLKSNIRTIDDAVLKVNKLRGVYFTKDDTESIGVIAQEVEKVIPEVVLDGEYKSVAYGNMVGLLIEAIKEQDKTINSLRDQVDILTGTVKALMEKQ